MMRLMTIVLPLFAVLGLCLTGSAPAAGADRPAPGRTALSRPRPEGEMSVEAAIRQRRSRRRFEDRALTEAQLSQLLWSAQGITEERQGFRAAPSAGATYPLEVYIVVGEATCGSLRAGVYRYVPQDHSLQLHAPGDRRPALASANLPPFAVRAPLVIVLAAEYGRTTRRYRERGIRYVHMEVGHVGQNVYLQAEALGLGTCAVGAFQDAGVWQVLQVPPNHEPLYILPVGYPQ